MELWANFFMVYNIDIHQLNIGNYKFLKFWIKFHSKNVFFGICVVNA